MYIKLINCRYVHIYDQTAFAFTTDNVCAFDEVSSCFISILKLESDYDLVKCIIKSKLSISQSEAIDLVDEIIQVNHHFLVLSNDPNSIMITGQLNFRYPSMLQISLTNRCVHRCMHCFKKCSFNGKDDIPYDTLISLLDRIMTECNFLELTGGEPLLYPHIMEVVNHCYNRLHIHITTSGYLLNDYSLSDLRKFDVIQISLHGSNNYTHDSFVGRKGSFQVVTNNIRWLCANNINVIVSRSISFYDKKEIDDSIKLCINLGVKRMIFGIIVPVGRALETKCVTPNDDFIKITNYLRYEQKQYRQIDIVLDEEHTVSKQSSKYMFHCIGGKLHLYINENGNVFPCPYCQNDSFSIGNIVDEPSLFDKIICDRQYDVFNQNLLKRYYEQENIIQGICPNIRKPEL